MLIPDKIRIVEVGPRDGFQNIKELIPSKTKIEVIDLLIASGIKEMEISSFVHPKAIPQMADAPDVVSQIVKKHSEKMRLIALVPNARGAEDALKCGLDTVTYVISASEAHNKANVNRTVQESCNELRKLIHDFPKLEVRLDLATAFGCPFNVVTPMDAVLRLADAAAEAGIRELVLCDTIGSGNPAQVALLSAVARERFSSHGLPVGLHLHDTRGMGLANTLAGLQEGITLFETSVGGLGGCPFAPGAAGNTATEDILNMLDAMSAETGVDFSAYLRAVRYVRDNIESNLTGHMTRVCMQQ